MANQNHDTPTITVTAVAGGLAWVRGRIVPGGGGRRWEYLGSHPVREEALAAARAEGGAAVHIDGESAGAGEREGIAPTRPPADS